MNLEVRERVWTFENGSISFPASPQRTNAGKTVHECVKHNCKIRLDPVQTPLLTKILNWIVDQQHTDLQTLLTLGKQTGLAL